MSTKGKRSSMLIAIFFFCLIMSVQADQTYAIENYYSQTEVNGEYCSSLIADIHINNGVDSMDKLNELDINGRPYELILEYVKEVEKKKLSVKAVSKTRSTRSTSTPKTSSHSVEQWRPLVSKYFKAQYVDDALSVMFKESRGNPNALNRSSGCAGLFQQHPRYWTARLTQTEKLYGCSLSSNIYDPEANIAVSAMLSNGGSSWSHWSVKP